MGTNKCYFLLYTGCENVTRTIASDINQTQCKTFLGVSLFFEFIYFFFFFFFVLFEKRHSWSCLALIHGLGYSRDGGREPTREQRGANADWTAKDKYVSHAHGICTMYSLHVNTQ